MAYITLLSSVLSFFLIAISADVQDIMVDEYYIDMQLYPTRNYFDVTCYFVFKNVRTTQEISMYIDDIVLSQEVSVIRKDTGVNLDLGNFVVNYTTSISTLFSKEKMDPGFYVMNITSSRYFDRAFKQVYSDHEEEVVWLSATHFQPIWIQRIIPCWVTPKQDISWGDMPTFNLSIRHYAHHSVLTNMPIRKEWLDENTHNPKMKRTYFDITPRMSPYQLSIVVTNFIRTIIDEDNVVSMWCKNRSASSLQFALTIAKNITTYLRLSKKWPRRSSTSVKLIVIPKIQNNSEAKFPEWNNSLVHPGIIIANEDDITYNEKDDTVGRKYNVIRLLGYKVMQEYHEWIVNPYWEPSTWLSKGSFATFIATHILDQIWPNLRMIDLFVVQIQHECLHFDVTTDMLPFPDQNETIPIEIIDNMKTSVILRMLQHLYTPETFWKAIDMFTYDSLLHEKKYHLKMFWEALEDAHDKIKKGSETYDLEGWMHLLVEEKGYPVLNIKRFYDTSTSSMELLVDFRKKIQSIPVSYTTRTNLNFNQTRPHSWPPYADPIWSYDYNLLYKYNAPIRTDYRNSV